MKKRRLNSKGRVIIISFSLIIFILFFYIVDRIRFEIDKNDSEQVYQLVINDEIIEPSRVITKANFAFDHYNDRERTVQVPLDSVMNLEGDYKLVNSAGDELTDEITYLPDDNYTLTVKKENYVYEYNLLVDNDFYALVDTWHARQGGYVVVDFKDLNEGEEVNIDTSFKSSSEFLITNNRVVVPIDLINEVGSAEITFRNDRSVTSNKFDINVTQANEYELIIDGYEKKQEPEEVDLESGFSKAVKNSSSEALYSNFIAPTFGEITTQFGDKLYINGDIEPTIIHNGIDYADGEGAAINATSSGKVIYTGSLDVYGNVVVIDHGFGITSTYYHLHEVIVENGSEVAVGSQIGTMGSTGNVNGVHVHFAIHINGVSVDPNIFYLGELKF